MSVYSIVKCNQIKPMLGSVIALFTIMIVTNSIMQPVLAQTEPAKNNRSEGVTSKPQQQEQQLEQQLEQQKVFDNPVDEFSYAFGLDTGQQFMGITEPDADINVAIFLEAMSDVLNKEKLKLSDQQIEQAYNNREVFVQKKNEAQEKQRQAEYKAFLAENKQRDGVVELPSGIQYEILQKAEEDTAKSPNLNSLIIGHYRGKLIDGQEFDNSYQLDKPFEVIVNAMMPGWQEVLPLMKEGEIFKAYVPGELAFGDRGFGELVQPNELVIFEIELLVVIDKEDK